MRIVTSAAAMQRLAKRWRSENLRIGLAPTMGFLHAGHISLVHRARGIVKANGKVVLSLYVNPTQFAPTEDLSRYPRDFERDKQLCQDEGVDVLFAPTTEEMYPPGEGAAAYSTFVNEELLSRDMEGASRPTHFRGVTTIVAKLFNIVLPDVSVFGAKDWQQAAIIQRMVRDLNFPVRIVVAPTTREADGLAMSSRNKYLSTDERAEATCLWLAIQRAREMVRRSSKPVAVEKLLAELGFLISERPSAKIDYIEFFDPETLQPVSKVAHGHQLALAVRVGATRLIDNGSL